MESRTEIVFNTLIDAAAEEALLQEMNEMPSCEELDKIYSPTPEMDLRMRKLIKRVENTQKTKKILVQASKSAMILFAFLAVATMVLIAVEASRNYIFNTFIQWNNNHTAIQFQPSDKSNDFDKYTLHYIPEGYKLDTTSSSENTRTFIYTNEKDENIFVQQSIADSAKLSVDNENNQPSIMTIHGFEAFFFQSTSDNDSNSLIWKENNIAFTLISSLDKNEMILIAENILKN